MRVFFGNALCETFLSQRAREEKDYGSGYCGDSVIRMRFQLGFYLVNKLHIFRSLPVSIYSWRLMKNFELLYS